MTKRYDEPIEVATEDDLPVSFTWRGQRYTVQRVLKHWRESTFGWHPSLGAEHHWFRVEADGGTYELRLDRRAAPEEVAWHLVRVWD
jgi:Family of unknown function (DUF6504)